MLEERGIIHRKTMLSTDEFRFGESLTKRSRTKVYCFASAASCTIASGISSKASG